ncbi:MAG: pectate lyase, partial [Parvicella sp.]
SVETDNSEEINGEESQELAFPGAEGFGKYATGGRGGEVHIVTNLNDSGEGSLREALRKKYPRIVLFAVSGYIELQSSLDVNYGDLTIAGQSAPGDGITIKNYPIKVKGDNVIIRYIRSRMGDQHKVQDDALSITGQKNIIVDHCSFSWSSDECVSIYDNENVTVQYCVISESLNKSVHAKGEHGYGGIWGGKKASFHHNLFAHHKSRNPRFNGSRYHKQPELEIVDFRNNVIYNWQSNNSYGGEEGNHNLINNYYKAGPATKSRKDKILDPYEPYGKFYLEGNILMGNDEVNADNWNGIKNKKELMPKIRLSEPLAVESISTESAGNAFESVLKNVGANYSQDAVDKRIIKDVKEGTATFGTGIIDSQSEVGGWPELKSTSNAKDSDQDGMPDKWEKKNGLDSKNPMDNGNKDLHKYYTNIEIYLNSLLIDN